MDDVRKKSLREVLPKKGLELGGKKTNPTRGHHIDIAELESDIAASKTAKTNKKYYGTRHSPIKISYFMGICIFLIFIVGGYYLSTAFASVTVKITPQQVPMEISGSFEANRAPAQGIEFSVIKLEESIDKQVSASGQAEVETKASGTVLITNNFSTADQTLVVGTRLEAPSGLIYKLDNTIIVPGRTATTPGSILVKVSASETGAKYNIDTASFKIVGFKGTAKYDKFSAQTKTSIIGGKQGLESVVKAEDRARAVIDAQTELKNKVTANARKMIPKDSVIFDDGVIMSFSDEIKNNSASGTATLSAKVTMVAVLFNIKNLSQYFAEKQLGDESVEGIRIANVEALVFKLQNKDIFNFEKTDKIDFTLNGKANLVWPIDTAGLKSKLLSTSIRDQNKVFASFPYVHRAEAVARPPWILSFPSNQDKINIKLIIQ